MSPAGQGPSRDLPEPVAVVAFEEMNLFVDHNILEALEAVLGSSWLGQIG